MQCDQSRKQAQAWHAGVQAQLGSPILVVELHEVYHCFAVGVHVESLQWSPAPPVATCAQFCMRRTSARSTSATSMKAVVRKHRIKRFFAASGSGWPGGEGFRHKHAPSTERGEPRRRSALRRLLKAMADRLKQDADERAASSRFEITGAGKLPTSMRVMQPATERKE